MKKIISGLTALVLSAGIILTPCAPSIGAEAYSYSNVMSASSSKAKPPATLKSLTNETFLKYTNIKSKYKPSSSKEKVYLYDFNTSMSKGFGEDDISLPTEADYGVKGTVSGRKLNVSVYDHTGKKSVKAVYVKGKDTSVRVRSSDGTYSGIYQVMPWDISIPMPSDARANQYFQYNRYNVY